MEKYLFQLCFDSHLRFASNLYFNYEDVDFKLVKGTKEQQDVLCTISEVQSSSGPAFGSVVETVYEKASRFLNCLSWEFDIGIVNSVGGGRGWRKEYGGLERVSRKICAIKPRTRGGLPLRVTRIVRLPMIDDDYKAYALKSFREAKAANSEHYRFLCYWKVLELWQRKAKEDRGRSEPVTSWIDDTLRANPGLENGAHFDRRSRRCTSVGKYLYDECRNAVAHVMPRHPFKPDSQQSLSKVCEANRLMRRLVDIFIRKELGVGSAKGSPETYLFLVKIPGKAIPVFSEWKGAPTHLFAVAPPPPPGTPS